MKLKATLLKLFQAKLRSRIRAYNGYKAHLKKKKKYNPPLKTIMTTLSLNAISSSDATSKSYTSKVSYPSKDMNPEIGKEDYINWMLFSERVVRL